MKILSRLVLTASLLFGSVANANIMVWLDPAVQPTSGTGDNISLTLMVGGLGNFSPASLAGFDLDILFDTSALSFTGYTLFNYLGVPSIDIDSGEAWDVSDGEYSSGIINLAVLSWLSPSELDDLQPSTFALAELFFHVDALISNETTALSLSVYKFTDALGIDDSLTVELGEDAQITAVPEPAPYLLFGIALLAIAFRKTISN